MFFLFINIISDGRSTCANIGLLIILSCSGIATYERDIPAISVITVMLILMDDKNTYTNDLRITSPGLQKLSQKDLLDMFFNDNASICTLVFQRNYKS
jgi:hypothetical protein